MSVTPADLPMFPVVLGALLGLYFFIRGCVLLQRKPEGSTDRPAALTPLVDATKIAAESSGSSKREIIRLSPDGNPDKSTQQGRIAAALLKAGVSTPSSWSSSGDKSFAALADQSEITDEPVGLVESLHLTTSRALERASGRSRLTHTASGSDSFQPFRWKPALMIWGGPILTLTCIYLLALHFGWL